MKLIPKDDFILLDKKIQITLNDIRIPFGIEKYYNDYVCKFSLNKENYILFRNIEDEVRLKLLDIDEEYDLKSQINEVNNFKSLTCKLFQTKNNILTQIIDENSKIISYADIKKKDRVNLIIFFDKLWVKDNIVYYKWKLYFIKKCLE